MTRPTARTAQLARAVVGLAAARLMLASAGGCAEDNADADADADAKKMDAIAEQIQTTLAQRSEVVKVDIVHQDNITAPASDPFPLPTPTAPAHASAPPTSPGRCLGEPVAAVRDGRSNTAAAEQPGHVVH